MWFSYFHVSVLTIHGLSRGAQRLDYQNPPILTKYGAMNPDVLDALNRGKKGQNSPEPRFFVRPFLFFLANEG